MSVPNQFVLSVHDVAPPHRERVDSGSSTCSRRLAYPAAACSSCLTITANRESTRTTGSRVGCATGRTKGMKSFCTVTTISTRGRRETGASASSIGGSRGAKASFFA